MGSNTSTIADSSVVKHPAWLQIDTRQFKKNLLAIRRKIGARLFCLPVKANGYGHGLVEMGKLGEQMGVDSLGVSCLQEAISLRQSGIAIPILIFGAIHEDQIAELIDWDLEFAISSQYKAHLVAKKWKGSGPKCKVHVEVDTGMQRTGVRPTSAIDLLRCVENLGCFELIGIYSHLASGDRPDDLTALSQIRTFQALIDRIDNRKLIAHLAASGGVAHYPDSYFDMVRPGLLAYGCFPDEEIRPILSLHAKISYFKVVGAGEGVSYGHTYRTSTETRIVTVPVGYGDGYRRSFAKNGSVLIRGEVYPIAGSICMDQFMVDIGKREAYVGEVATLIGRQGDREISLLELAQRGDSIPHEILVGFNSRLPRIYTAYV